MNDDQQKSVQIKKDHITKGRLGKFLSFFCFFFVFVFSLNESAYSDHQ